MLGSLMIFADGEDGRKGFLLSPAQAGLAVLVVVVLVATALLPRWRGVHRGRAGRVPHPLVFGSLALAVHLGLWFVAGWPGVGARVLAVVAVVAVVGVWSRRSGWTQRHVVAGWSAGLLAAAAGAGLSPAYQPMSAAMAVASDVTVGVVALMLVVTAYRLARDNETAGAEQPAPSNRW
ncbi:hypothetical protein [Actinoplanes sp. DH11]|uniref:hypothetical protein n=1 Tax=Actinoplanes sp. DH11 TaxID=2857011 RepID=UPI001E439443|nr:hypothetical protein [Actinoplanes sp. DH11]